MIEPREYDFGERLVMSQGVATGASVRAILLANIPGAVEARKAHRSNDRNGTDWWVEMNTGRHLSVDCKIRSEDWTTKPRPSDDLALETFSVMESAVVGWTRNVAKLTDYTLWFWKDTRRWCLIPFPMLCAVFCEHWLVWKNTYEIAQQKTLRRDGSEYHSECVYVPRRVVWRAIYLRFGGQLMAPTAA